MTPLEILKLNQAESDEVEAEIRARHQLVDHGMGPIPVICPGGCCTCNGYASGCETRHVLSMLDKVRAQFIKHRTATHKIEPTVCLTCQESDIILGVKHDL